MMRGINEQYKSPGSAMDSTSRQIQLRNLFAFWTGISPMYPFSFASADALDSPVNIFSNLILLVH